MGILTIRVDENGIGHPIESDGEILGYHKFENGDLKFESAFLPTYFLNGDQAPIGTYTGTKQLIDSDFFPNLGSEVYIVNKC